MCIHRACTVSASFVLPLCSGLIPTTWLTTRFPLPCCCCLQDYPFCACNKDASTSPYHLSLASVSLNKFNQNVYCYNLDVTPSTGR
jgi:hypothetical protein